MLTVLSVAVDIQVTSWLAFDIGVVVIVTI